MRLWNNRYAPSLAPPEHAAAAMRVLATNTVVQACFVGTLCACIARFAFVDAITPSNATAPSPALFGGWFAFAAILYLSACYFAGGGGEIAPTKSEHDDDASA